ncbi:MAG: organomercurial lyase [Planctomycetota bacterium]
MKIAVAAAAVVLVVGVFVARSMRKSGEAEEARGTGPAAGTTTADSLPRFVDLGSKTCIPCKMMAPILEELRSEYEGRLRVEFINVEADPEAGTGYRVSTIPTQIWYDASGKELKRHEGFIPKEDILAVFSEHGIDLGGKVAAPPKVVRGEPLAKDTRPPEAKCFMCERDIDGKIKVTIRSRSGGLTHLCSPHCYFIMESCLLDKSSVASVAATDHASRHPVPFAEAVWLCGADESGRPTVKAFATSGAAQSEMHSSGGSVLALDALREKEYSVRCGFCDRAMYPQDNGSTVQVVGGPKTHGCCPHCALGVVARLGKDIIVENNDPVTGGRIRIETFDGRVKSLDPPTAVAWFGQRKKPDGTFKSAGCFHQWNFTSVANLRKWLETHPRETGRLITIHQALAAKMKMSPEKMKKACKIGECK